MRDQTYRKHILNSKLLNNQSKESYLNRLKIIQNDIWQNCKSVNNKVGKGKCLNYIIKHPEAFMEKLEEYVNKTEGRLDKTKLSIHAKDSYVSAIGAIFRHTPGMIQKEHVLYQKWIDLHKEVREPISQKYKTNKPTERQEKAYISFDELIKIRNKLKQGSYTRLIISLYTMIPPVRSDYYKVKIYKDIKQIPDDNSNYLVLNKKPYIGLRKYKTSKTYKTIKIDIPNELQKEIEASLKMYPREYLFVQKNGTSFDKPNTFNKWANRLLKTTINEKFSLTTFRHIYITRRDLKLEEKSGIERDEVARIMGHSIATQQNYLWHTYEKEKNKN
jgi:integrase